MTTPAHVRLHPDGRAVVRLDIESARPWIALGAAEGAYLDIEAHTDAEAAEWPAYAPPCPPIAAGGHVVPDFLADAYREAHARHPRKAST